VTPLAGQKAIVAKLGMDAHWRGAIVVATALRDAGMEVVYIGHSTPDQLAAVVSQEDPILVGLSSLSGNHMSECQLVLDRLRGAGISDVVLVVGGAIPPSDEARLCELGVDAVFPTGTSLRVIIDRISDLVAVADRARLG